MNSTHSHRYAVAASLVLLGIVLGQNPSVSRQMPGRWRNSPGLIQNQAGFAINAIAFAPGGRRLASGAADSGIILWDAGTGRAVRELKGHEGPVRNLCFLQDGSSLISGGDGSLMLWNVGTGKVTDALAERGNIRTEWTGRGSYQSLNLRKNPLVRYPESILTGALLRDGRIFACGGGNNSVLVWDTSTWEYRILRSSDGAW